MALHPPILLKIKLLLADAFRVQFFASVDGRTRCARNVSRACAPDIHHVKRLSHLLHDSSLSLWKRRVPPQFVFYVFHLYFNSALRLLAVARGRLLGLERTIRVIRYVINTTCFQSQVLRWHSSFVVTYITSFKSSTTTGTWHHAMSWRQLLEARRRPTEIWVAVNFWGSLATQQVHAVSQVESGISPARWFHLAPQLDYLIKHCDINGRTHTQLKPQYIPDCWKAQRPLRLAWPMHAPRQCACASYDMPFAVQLFPTNCWWAPVSQRVWRDVYRNNVIVIWPKF